MRSWPALIRFWREHRDHPGFKFVRRGWSYGFWCGQHTQAVAHLPR